MEKRSPHYPLREIQQQMRSVAELYLTKAAQQGIRRLRMTEQEVLQVITNLNSKHFVKSMTTYADHRIWQDVYQTRFRGVRLYVKFQKLDEYFVISFKECDDG